MVELTAASMAGAARVICEPRADNNAPIRHQPPNEEAL